MLFRSLGVAATPAPWAAAAAAARAPPAAASPSAAAALVFSPGRRATAAAELAGLFLASFGNPGRLDYGTGHEMSFAALLAALCALGVYTEDDLGCLGARVFSEYLVVVRRVQRTYWLEPAGSKGAWGLDDYQFLPFLWGAAQLARCPELPTPAAAAAKAHAMAGNQSAAAASSHSGSQAATTAAVAAVPASQAAHASFPTETDGGCANAAADVSKTSQSDREQQRQQEEEPSLLLDAVAFVCRVKTGPLAVHSPYVASLFEVPSWERLAAGLCRMYGGEVLAKLQVMQHTLFTSLLSAEPPADCEPSQQRQPGAVSEQLDPRAAHVAAVVAAANKARKSAAVFDLPAAMFSFD